MKEEDTVTAVDLLRNFNIHIPRETEVIMNKEEVISKNRRERYKFPLKTIDKILNYLLENERTLLIE